MKTKLILDINKTQYAQLNSIVTGRVGDKSSNVVDVFVIDNGAPYNLTGNTVFFECVKPDNTFVRDNNGVKIIDAAQGYFEYTFPTQTFGFAGKAKRSFFSIEKNSTVRATTQDFELVTLADAQTNRIPSETYISELDELISEAADMVDRASGSPRGVYATLAALKAALPNGGYGIYIVSADGKWYYWDNNNWVAGGTYQSTGIADLAVSKDKLANHAVSYQKLNTPEVQLISQNKVTINFKTRKITLEPDCFASVDGIVFNINPTLSLEFSIPTANDGALHLLTYNHVSKSVNYVRYTNILGSDMVIMYIYNKKIHGKNSKSILVVNENDNYDTLTEQNVKVFNQNIVSDAIDYTKLRLAGATIMSVGLIDVDFKKLTITIKPRCFAMIQNRIMNLNPDATNIVLNIPSSQKGIIHMLVADITNSVVSVSLIPYSTTDTTNKRILLYIYNDKVLGPNTSHVNVTTVFGKNEKTIVEQKPKVISEHLSNPFIKTTVKLIGDSITAGIGGTGYSVTGDPIGNTGYKTNIPTAVCWANMLRDHLLNKYNKDVSVAVNDPKLQYSSNTHKISENASTQGKWQAQFLNTSTANGIKFDFYGDNFTIIHAGATGGGIMEILIDGVRWGELDAYSSTFTNDLSFKVTGLSLKNHTVEIRETNRKNENSLGNTVFLQGLKIPKVVEVINFGISGKHSLYIYQNLVELISANDDFIIMQIGTNDRHSYKDTSPTKAYLREIIKYIQNLGKDIILMSANPVSLANDNDSIRNFKMDDVDQVVGQVAKEFSMNYISNYKGFMNYAINTGVTIDSLLKDGLHPNDTGYKVMFESVANHLGLTLLRDGISYI
ncbi:BppU family phage baseplate upper protein [Bacillus sp. FSL M7-0996]|uniref:BppU family phage baseplate upper protein n=1 Tax=Bacillus sp. FSL M7-0996 TaxID=2921538 RepID=UPI0030F8F1DE